MLAKCWDEGEREEKKLTTGLGTRTKELCERDK
jgi:hypothetical protein